MSDPNDPPRPSDGPSDGLNSIVSSLKDIFTRSREEIVRGAKVGRVRLDLLQLRKDRQEWMERLGAAAFSLHGRGELRHPDLDDAVRTIKEIDRRVQQFERDVARMMFDEGGHAATTSEPGVVVPPVAEGPFVDAAGPVRVPEPVPPIAMPVAAASTEDDGFDAHFASPAPVREAFDAPAAADPPEPGVDMSTDDSGGVSPDAHTAPEADPSKNSAPRRKAARPKKKADP